MENKPVETLSKLTGFSNLANGSVLREILENKQPGPALPVSKTIAGRAENPLLPRSAVRGLPKRGQGCKPVNQALGAAAPAHVLLLDNSYGKVLL